MNYGGTAVAILQLIVGTVRDQNGAPFPAQVLGLNASGAAVSRAQTAADGTFALHSGGEVVQIEVRCRHCRSARLAASGREPLVFVIHRYLALDDPAPAGADLAALPYASLLDAASLAPYEVAQGPYLSDRGLSFGRGVVFEGGVPAYDAVTGATDISQMPDRLAQAISFTQAGRGFEYGAAGSGGIVSVDNHAPSLSGEADSDAVSAHSGWPGIAPSGAISWGQTALARASLDGSASFGSNGPVPEVLQATVQTGASGGDTPGNVSLAGATLAAQSGGVRVLASVGGSRIGTNYYGDAWWSSAVVESLRVERSGPLTLAAGSVLRQTTATIGSAGQSAADTTVYVDASAGSDRSGLFAGLGVDNVSLDRESFAPSLHTAALLGSLSGRAPLGEQFSLAAGISSSLYAPDLIGGLGGVNEIARLQLAQASLDFDDGNRFRAGLTAFGENAHGGGDGELEGLGVSVAWQLAPYVNLRAWTLHDDAGDTYGSLYAAGGSFSRAVAWLSYQKPVGMRLDLIYRLAGNPASSHLDADIVLPVKHLRVTAGTAYENGAQRIYAGLQL